MRVNQFFKKIPLKQIDDHIFMHLLCMPYRNCIHMWHLQQLQPTF